MKIKIFKTLSGWSPYDNESVIYHKKFSLDDIYHMDVSRFKDQRTIELNGLYWSILTIVVENQNYFVNKKQLHIRIKKVLGIVEKVYNPIIMQMEEEVGSTAFDKMDNETFKQYFKDAVEFIKRYVLPGVTEFELIEAACKRSVLREENRKWINDNYKR